MISFSERLIIARGKKGLTQQQVADLIGVKSGKQTISKWEKATSEPSVSELIKLAEILETTVAWLVEGIEGDGPYVMQEPPAGYVLMPMEEVIQMQRAFIKQQNEQQK